ncbi:MFS transporter [Virgisporangium ochraceum]|uniref:Quaternary ammonium compound efflux MFS transporter QacA n=1 Tax=Virgisporangium ochraceum TaxID=65505 RepID=A0A8J4A3F2_9ACTN|nr:MFS transporter [Virgisporangium ochraceum]GIJ73155.1 quaternary ammonium compound efflux MFS transporter QacA [Virgisporangium ochraceum]
MSAARRWGALAVLSASLLVVVMDLTILTIALPDLAADLRPSATQQLWIIDSYSLVLAGLLVTVSALADRWGRRRMLLAGFVVFGGASALVLVARSAEVVVAVRALLGVGGAMIMPTTLSLIRSVFTDPRERATALGVWSAVAALGAAVGPIVGGLLLEHSGWRAAFLVNVPCMVVALVAGALVLPEARDPRPGRWDLVGTALSIAGMVLVVWAVKHIGDPAGVAAFVAGLALLGRFVLRCLRRTDPLLDVRLFRNRPFTAGVVAAFGSTAALAAALLLLAQWLQLVLGQSPLESGVHLLPVAAGGLVGSPLAPALAARIGARAVLAGGLAVGGAGLLLVPVSTRYPVVAVAMFLVGAGTGALAIASAMIMGGTPPERAGNAAAVEETAYDLGNVIGVAVLGSVAASLYRDGLGAAAPGAGESLGAAVEIAAQTGQPALAERARDAFVTAMADTSLVAGLIMLVVAVVVFTLVDRDLDPTR